MTLGLHLGAHTLRGGLTNDDSMEKKCSEGHAPCGTEAFGDGDLTH